ncbi:hypothetical protein [uncultured Methanofollis sp.]|uniref:hypothetical protein n=1 Tax=uncultured Methanofollis sp. TaxID=262500 RepID=UPI002619C5A0|nr:hypothetical protein [uncultured Methanofollis sp.]
MDHSPALARLEQAILLLVILGGAGIAFNLYTGPGTENPVGIVPDALASSPMVLLVDPPLQGYSDPADPGRIGSVSISLRLFPGSVGAVDMDRATVLFSTPDGSETCGTEPVPPHWAITGRLNALPIGAADDDNLLETGEEFIIRVQPSRTLAPGETFTLTVAPPRGPVVKVTRTVPPKITPVTDLG